MHTKEQTAYLLGDVAMDQTLSVEKREELGNEGLQFLHRHIWKPGTHISPPPVHINPNIKHNTGTRSCLQQMSDLINMQAAGADI